MRSLKTGLLAALCVAAQPASAVRIIEQLETCYEATIGDVRFAARESGSMTVKPCEGCTTETLSVTTETRYMLQTDWVDQRTFAEGVDRIRTTARSGRLPIVGVCYDKTTRRVSSLGIRTP